MSKKARGDGGASAPKLPSGTRRPEAWVGRGSVRRRTLFPQVNGSIDCAHGSFGLKPSANACPRACVFVRVPGSGDARQSMRSSTLLFAALIASSALIRVATLPLACAAGLAPDASEKSCMSLDTTD